MISLYLLAKDKPVWAAAAISLGFMKAGILLLLPTFLGFVQFYWGTIVLLRSVAVFLCIQVFFAAPFCIDWAAKLLGFSGAHTGWSYYLRFIFGFRKNGADHANSAYWSKIMLSTEVYESDGFVNMVKAIMLLLNIYFFFFKFNGLP